MTNDTIEKQKGITPAERYLSRLCEKTFLSLWSYPNVVRDVFVPGTRIGKEVCDLLVLFEDRVLIFSDKDCNVPRTGKLELDWSRWFRKAVLHNAKQAHGAERWLREQPQRLFLDRQCTRPLPVAPNITERTRFHLIVVAHNIAERCQEEMRGGSGSLMLESDLRGAAAHKLPFRVGDIDPERSFVHVLDDTSLHVLMEELDTIADFVAYLDKKEELFRSGVRFFAVGEEELLAWYLRHINDKEEHYFKLPDAPIAGALFDEGLYAEYRSHPQHLAKVQANQVSYSWDALIERFSFHALRGSQYFSTPGGVADAERIMRFMAREPRTRRRMLARSLVNCVVTTPSHLRRTAVAQPSSPADPYYVFLMLPWNDVKSEAENREMRRTVLQWVCMVVRLKWPDALDVVGIASESGNRTLRRTEDAMYCNFRDWTNEDAQVAEEVQKKLGILVNPPEVRTTENEYPELVTSRHVPRVGRNDPCPCGSGRKYKKCHGSR